MTILTVNTGLFGVAEQSSTSNSATTGKKTFTLDVDNGFVQTDYTVQIVSTADPDCWMYGVVVSKSSPSVTVSVFKVSGVTGTFADWTIQTIAGPFAGLPASQTLGFSTNVASVPAIGDSLSWTVETGKAFYDNSTVYVTAVNDRTAFFFATVVSYNSGTGALKLVVNRASGSGSNSLWAISLIDVTESFLTTHGNSDYTILPSDRRVSTSAALSAVRTWTLPAANSVPPGETVEVSDAAGGITLIKYILVVPAGADTVNGATGLVIDAPYGKATFTSDGVSRWSCSANDAHTFSSATFSDVVTFNGILQSTNSLLAQGGITVPDNTFTIQDNLDATKQLRFQVAGLSTGTIRTLTAPDASDTIAVLGTAQTFTSLKSFSDSALKFLDSGASGFGMLIRDNETLTANRNLNIVLGDAARILTFSGNPTLDNWFDQSVKTTASPVFSAMTATGAGGVGYATGAGGTKTQLTSKATAVTLNAPSGRITMNNALLAASTAVSFTFTNSSIGADDLIVVNHRSGGTLGNYVADGTCTAASTATIWVRNLTAGGLSDALVLEYAIIKGATS